MSDKVRVYYDLPEDVTADLEFMCVLTMVYESYADKITETELQAAMEWFKCWTVAQLEKT